MGGIETALLLAILLVAAAWIAGAQTQAGVYFLAGWLGLLAGSIASILAYPTNVLFFSLFGPVFAAGLLAGALALDRGRVPRWVAPAMLAAIGVRLAGARGGIPELEALVAFGVEPGALLGAAVVALGTARRRGGWALWSHSFALAALAVLDAVSSRWTVAGAEVPAALVAAWVPAVGLTFPLELRLTGDRLLRAQRKAMAALRTSQERYRALTEAAFDVVAEIDEEGRVLYVNERTEEIFGVPARDFSERNPLSFVRPSEQPAAEKLLQEARVTGAAGGLVLEAMRGDGSPIWIELAIRAFVNTNGERHFVMNARDVSRRKALEAILEQSRIDLEETVAERTHELRESEARFRALAEHAPELISEFDEDGRYVYASPSFRDLLGYEPEALTGTSPELLIHPDDLAESRRGMVRALRETTGDHAIHRLRHADGRWRWFDNTGRAYRNREGELRFVSIGRDVTDQRKAELERRRIEARMQEAQRLESLGVLAGGIAHDFNNLLAVIQGNASLLDAEAGETPESRGRLRRIREASQHARGLTEQMLTYAGRAAFKLLPLDLSRLVEETRDLAQASVSKKCRLVFDLDGPLTVEGDDTQLRQVLLNLVTNASDSLAGAEGVVRVRVGCTAVRSGELADAHGCPEKLEGEVAFLEVADNGAGMSEDLQRRIFEPFYSTKRAGRGLGLAAVLGIARNHAGAIAVQSASGEGTTFRLLLPIAEERVVAARPAPEAPLDRTPLGATALVVDDEPAVRDVAEVFLRHAGFRVLGAGGGREALDALREHRDEIDVAVVDLTMPDLAGDELCEALHEIRADLPIVIVSGYSRDLASPRMGELAGFVQKPYEPRDLVTAVRRALAPPPH